jgi:hypothetical protein
LVGWILINHIYFKGLSTFLVSYLNLFSNSFISLQLVYYSFFSLIDSFFMKAKQSANSFVFHAFKISKTVFANHTNITKLRNKQKTTSKGIKKSAIPNGEATIK